ncbi:hypothetical protein PNOK_0826900 [Pyrrhoderma noxium]|uniref:DUF6533 domain-containing protein n=1 Tax=Pyrrhoderma noxium TaxID=2282107 RepID=A0A286UAQ3_9AGAM|nr:hypothetical protein PNOK_0826900 [Pyrrhoderma noxium]
MTPDLGHFSLEELIKEVYCTRLWNYTILSALVLYIYYYVTTLDSEVSVMWGAGFGIGKLIFYSIRYFTLFYVIFINIGLSHTHTNVSAETLVFWHFPIIVPGLRTTRCKILEDISYISTFVIILLADFALQLKLYALYQKSKRILTFMVIISISMVIYYTTFAAMVIKNWTIILVTDSEVNLSTHYMIYPSYYNKALIPKLITEGIMLALALRVGVKNMRQNGGIEMSNSLLNLIVKDSIFYFVVIFSLCLSNQLLRFLADPEFFPLPGPIILALEGTLSQHLLINVRIQASKRGGMETEFSLEGIRFRSGLGSDEGVPDGSFGSVYSITSTAD